MKINNRTIGSDHATYIIAEVGLAHDGSLGAAHAFVDAAASADVDAIKFQTHIPAEESSPFEQFRVNVFPQDATRYQYWQRTSFTRDQWLKLADYTRSQGLDFLSSPFSAMAVEWLDDCGVTAWKIASGEVTNYPMLRQMAATGKPLLISSGMSDWAELDRTIEFVRTLKTQDGSNCEFGIFQCTTSYPCPAEKWGLNIITEMLKRYQCAVGLSDHSGTIFPSLAARMLGASMLEFHVVFDHGQFGPDTKASLTFEQTNQLVRGIRSIETALKNPIDKDAQAQTLTETRKLFAKSLYAAHDLEAGHTLTDKDLLIRKPLIGVSAADYDSTLGKKMIDAVAKDQPIQPDNLN